MINYGKHFISNADINSVIKVLKSSSLTQGKEVKSFEKKICSTTGAKYAVAVSSGTSALFLIGKILKWTKNDIILTTPITFVASANAALFSSAQVDFVDIDPKSYNISLEELEKKIQDYKKWNKKISAVIATDFAGNPCDWKELSDLSKKYNFKLISDHCHALGSEYNYDKKYILKYADFASLSFHPVKAITTGEGGAILTNSLHFYNEAKLYSNHCKININKKNEPWRYDISQLGYNFRITDFQSALGSSQLNGLKNFVTYRRRVAKIYDDLFQNNKYLQIPKTKNGSKHSYHLYPLLINFKKLKKKKITLFKILKRNGYNLMVHYPPLHLLSIFKKKNYKSNIYINSEKFYKNELSLPIYFNINEKKIKKIAKLILNFTNNKSPQK